MSLEIRKGESLAIVGPSGAGKTTVADMLLGLIRPSSGTIELDGRWLAADEVIASISYVPQSIYLLDDTLRRNVAFGIADFEIDDARVQQALTLAQMDELLASLPDGINTFVGERGVRLSGGQRQRIGIARALYGDPEFLVLDEATAALDVETERRFTDTVHDLASRKTLVVIAHRLSTVRQCHRIAFMENSRIVDVAPFDELLLRNARFRELVEVAELRTDHVLT